MKTDELIREVRRIAEIGIVNQRHDVPTLVEAADRLEELDERVAIMMEGTGITAEQLDMLAKIVRKIAHSNGDAGKIPTYYNVSRET